MAHSFILTKNISEGDSILKVTAWTKNKDIITMAQRSISSIFNIMNVVAIDAKKLWYCKYLKKKSEKEVAGEGDEETWINIVLMKLDMNYLR